MRPLGLILMCACWSVAAAPPATRPAPVADEVAILTDSSGPATVRRGGTGPSFPAESLMGLGAGDVVSLMAAARAVVVFNTGYVATLDGPGTFEVQARAVRQTAPQSADVALRGATGGDQGLPLADTRRLAILADAPVTRTPGARVRPGVPYRDILADRPLFRWQSTLDDRAFALTLFKDDQKTVVGTIHVKGLIQEFPAGWPALERDRTYYWQVAAADHTDSTARVDFTVVSKTDAAAVTATLEAVRRSFRTSLTALRLMTDHLLARELYSDALPYAELMAEAAPASSRALLTLKAVYKALEMREEAEAIGQRLKALEERFGDAVRGALATAPASRSRPAAGEAASDTAPTHRVVSESIRRRQDEVRTLIDDGRFEDARTRLAALEQELAGDSAPERRLDYARVLKLTGILHHHLGAGTADEAAAWYGRALAALDAVAPATEALRLDVLREKTRVQNDLGALRLGQGEDRALERTPNVFEALGRYREALAAFEESLCLAEAAQDPALRSDARSNLGGFYRSFGDFYQLIRQDQSWADRHYARALTEHRAALDLERGLPAPRPMNLARNELGLGNVLFRQGKYAEARSAFERAIAVCDPTRAQGHPEPFYTGLESAHRNIGLAYLAERGGGTDRALADQALEHLRVAAAMGAHLRTQVAPGLAGRYRASVFSDRVYVHEKLVELLVERGEMGEAFRYAEEAKARAFLDLLGRSPLDSRPSKTENPAAAVVSPEEVKSFLGDDAALVEYLLGREAAFVFVVFRGRLTARRLAAEPADLVKKVVACRRSIEERGFTRGPGGYALDHTWQDRLAELHGLLLEPVQADLAGARRLVVVPHHVLHYLPFGALVTKAEAKVPSTRFARPTFLVEGPVDVATAPSASALAAARRRNTGRLRTALILANAVYPSPWVALPGTEREAKAVAPLFESRVLVGSEATEAVLKAEAARYDILYLATHGLLAPESALKSHLFLTATTRPAEDGTLTAEELFRLNGAWPANLVVLSACQSGLSDPSPSAGDDLVGLTRAFMAAGSPSVVATLWNVSDRTSAVLMADFFKALKAGRDKDAALGDAQRAMIATARRDETRDIHPFYWAAFVLVGDPRARPKA